ncbi:MAG TPA: AsmA family protein [Rudaea sp.]|nr:AsmA family protein [Rudaea sp.]
MIKRSIKLFSIVVGAMLLLVVVAIAIVATFDWNRAKPWLSRTVADATGRSVTIDGDLRVTWRRDPDLDGWRSLLPTPHVTAGKVVVGNTAWAKKAPDFIRAESVDFDVAVFPLLAHTISIHEMRFAAPLANLERLGDGRANWHLTVDGTPATDWTIDIGSIALDRGKFTFFDHQRQIDVSGDLDALGQSIPFDDLVTQQVRQARNEVLSRIGPKATKRFEERADKRAQDQDGRRKRLQQYAFAWSAQGTYAKEAFKGTGKLGGVFFLRDPDRPFPLQADVRIGDTRIAFVGVLIDPTDLDSLDLRLWLAGSNLSKLYDIAQIPLPNSPPYAMEGRLDGRFTHGAKDLHYRNFTARIGESDLSGDLEYVSKNPRPLLSGKVVSDELQFRDLATLIGADVQDAKSSTGRIIPVTPFRPERWRVMDADVQFSGDHVFRDSELPIHKVETRIRMDDAVLSLDPFKFRYAWGDVESTLRFDGRAAPIKATFDLTARDMQLKHLVPGLAADQLTLGRADGAAKLAASGDSIGALLGAASGELKLVLDGGTISKGLIETAGLNLPNMVVTKLFGDKPVKIDCAAADLVASGGIFDSRTFIDTDIALIAVTGKVDLRNETVDLVVRPDSKGIRLLSLRSPLHVKGPFKNIDVSIDKGTLLARAAGAIGLAALAAPAAALLPLTSTNLGSSESRCEALVRQMPKIPAGATKTAPNGKAPAATGSGVAEQPRRGG